MKPVIPAGRQTLQFVFLIAAGYVLNAALRLGTPVLWIRSLACLWLAAALCKPSIRYRWALVGVGCALYAASFFNPYRVARVTAYVQQNYL